MKETRKGFRPRRKRGRELREDDLLVITPANIDPISQYYGKGPPPQAFMNKGRLPSDLELSLYREYVRTGGGR